MKDKYKWFRLNFFGWKTRSLKREKLQENEEKRNYWENEDEYFRPGYQVFWTFFSSGNKQLNL